MFDDGLHSSEAGPAAGRSAAGRGIHWWKQGVSAARQVLAHVSAPDSNPEKKSHKAAHLA